MIEDGVAEVGEAIENVQQFFYVVEVQAGGGLIENIQSAAGLAAREFAGQLDALGFAAGKRGGGLAELDVAEADVDQRFELQADLRNVFQHFQRFVNRHVQQVGNRVALVSHGKRLGVVAAAAADFAGDVNVRKEIHFDAAQAVALAGFAAAAFYVEAEAARLVAALARFGQHGEEFADGREDAGIGGGIGARRAPDGRLIDLDDFVDVARAPSISRNAPGCSIER